MPLHRVLQQLSILLFTTFTLALGATAQAQTHVKLERVQPSETSSEIEILEFFAYTCGHCKTMEPMVAKWSRELPGDITLMRVPVAFNNSMQDLQKLYYTLENLERLDLHPAVFKAIHDERKQIYNAAAIIDWAVEQGLDRQEFSDVFNSFGINTRVERANELAKNYGIDGTPSLAVGGRYVTDPAMTNSYEGTLEEADRLIEKVRDELRP